MAELEQLPLNPPIPPPRLLPRHPHYQCGETVVDRWSTGAARVGPPSPHEAAVPAQDCVGGDQAMATEGLGQPPDEGGEHGPVCPVDAGSWVGAPEHRDLVPQHEELDVLGGGRASRQQDQPEHLLEDQGIAAATTWRRSCRTVDRLRSPLVSGACHVLEPHKAHVPFVALPSAGALRQVERPDLSALLTHFCSRGRPLGAGVPPDVHAMSVSDRLRSILWEQRLRAFVTYSGGDSAVCLTEATLAGLQFLIGKRGYQPWGWFSTARASMTPVVDRFGMRDPSSTTPSARTILRFDPGLCAWTPARTGWRSGSGGSCGPQRSSANRRRWD